MTKIIGLTGGIGSVKSTVAKMFEALGVPVYIADLKAKAIMDMPEVIQEVQSIFNQNVLTEENKLDRKKIASIVFEDSHKLSKLNEIIHPKVQKDFNDWTIKHLNYRYIIKELAILFENKAEKQFDKIILVTAPLEIRINRVIMRDKITRNEVLNRINNQLPDSEKIKRSDFIINNLDLKSTEQEVLKIHQILNALK
ncbi:MAG: dephospho-CoA kinase [Bacteroidota bacterium]|nr:dephospho-CoA kinase [Bacteroidota bacterium]